MLGVFVVLVLIGVVLTIAAAVNKAQLWMAVFVLYVIELLRVLPR